MKFSSFVFFRLIKRPELTSKCKWVYLVTGILLFQKGIYIDFFLNMSRLYTFLKHNIKENSLTKSYRYVKIYFVKLAWIFPDSMSLFATQQTGCAAFFLPTDKGV